MHKKFQKGRLSVRIYITSSILSPAARGRVQNPRHPPRHPHPPAPISKFQPIEIIEENIFPRKVVKSD